MVCHSSQACESRLRLRRDQRVVLDPIKHLLRETVWPEGCETHVSSRVPVHLLQVCRQIYHEAVLKPFAQATFDFISPEAFLAKLVPGQARAIARTRFMCDVGWLFNLSKGARSSLKGLKHVEIHYGIDGYYMPPPFGVNGLNEVAYYLRGSIFNWLSGISLESLRFTIGIESMGLTEALRADILELIERREDEILSK
jgi:hypothetical protein